MSAEMRMTRSRDEFLDVCKGIGILCVYYGHTVLWGTLPSCAVFSFHMALFFLVSGMLFKPDRIADFRVLLCKVWRNLLLPYCFFTILGQILKFPDTYANWCSSPLLQIARIVHGDGSNAIWFLMCLSVVQMMSWSICRKISGRKYY